MMEEHSIWAEEPVLTEKEILQEQVAELLHNYQTDIPYYMQKYIMSEEAATEMFLNEIRYADKMDIGRYKVQMTNEIREVFFAIKKMPEIVNIDKMDEEESYEIFERFYSERACQWRCLLSGKNWDKAKEYALEEVKALTRNPYSNDNIDYGYIYLALLDENAKENFIKNHTKKNS